MLPINTRNNQNELRYEMNLFSREDLDLLELFEEGPSKENIDLSDWSFTKADAGLILNKLYFNEEEKSLLELFPDIGSANKENIDLSDWCFNRAEAAAILKDLNFRS